MKTVHYVPTGVGNVASLRAAFGRLGCELVPVRDAGEAEDAPSLVLPGVGQFGAAETALAAGQLAGPLRRRLSRGAPTLAVCLGMQLCCDASDEAPGVAGLGVVPGVVRRFPVGVRCPHMGWNEVLAAPGARLLASGAYYFANSFRLVEPPPDWTAAMAVHAGPFVAALERGPVLLCQFHPELSGAVGAELLRRWLVVAEEATCCRA